MLAGDAFLSASRAPSQHPMRVLELLNEAFKVRDKRLDR